MVGCSSPCCATFSARRSRVTSVCNCVMPSTRSSRSTPTVGACSKFSAQGRACRRRAGRAGSPRAGEAADDRPCIARPTTLGEEGVGMTTAAEPTVDVVDHQEYEQRVASLFRHVGVPERQAAGIAEIVVLADLRGMESHGTNFAPRYLRGLAKGELNPEPELRFVGGRGAVAVLDADNGLGYVSARAAMER